MARFAGTELSNFLGTMDYSGVSKASQEGRSLERRAAMSGEAEIANAGVKSMGMIQSAEYKADAIKADGQAQMMGHLASGISSAVSGIAGGIGNMPTGGGSGGFSMSNGTSFNPYKPTPGGIGGVTSYDLNLWP